jgi:hypothetical protein
VADHRDAHALVVLVLGEDTPEHRLHTKHAPEGPCDLPRGNLLGFAVGLAIADVLADPWVPVAAVVAVGLNVLADTVTFSRVIDATPPLRWADGLGRRP